MHRVMLNSTRFGGSNDLGTFRKAFIMLPWAIYPIKAAAQQIQGYILGLSFIPLLHEQNLLPTFSKFSMSLFSFYYYITLHFLNQTVHLFLA